jgi:Tfp pilus assembly protein PilF
VNPQHLYAWNNLGRVHWRAIRHDSARAAFERQIAVNPNDQWAHANLGGLLLDMRRPAEAVPALKLAASVTPNSSSVMYNLGRAYLASDQTDSAITAFRTAIAIRGTSTILNNIAYALAEKGVALDVAEQWARAAIDSAVAATADLTIETTGPQEYFNTLSLGNYWDTLGWILFRKGDLAGAERYVWASWIQDQRRGVGDHLVQIYERQGRRPEAARIRAAAGEIEDPDPSGPPPSRAMTQSARRALLDQRTVRAGRSAQAVTGDVTLVLGPGNVVHEVQGAENLQAIIRPLSGGPVALFPFPDSSALRLPKRALVTCPGGNRPCSVIYYDATSWTSTRRVLQP